MNELPQATPTSLLTQCKNNLPEGWERLKKLYERLILYWCVQRKVEKTDRYDIFQEVMLAVMKNIGNFRKDKPSDSFRNWLRTITYSKIVDFVRKSKRSPALAESLTNIEQPLCTEAMREEDAAIQQGLIELLDGVFDSKALDAFRMMVFGKMTSAEVGEKLGMTAAAVRQAKLRVYRRIQNEFGELL